jgi:hypothetical protein
LDPGIGGTLLQLGYVLFYGLVGALAFLGKPLAFLFRKKKPAEGEEEDGKASEDKEAAEPPDSAEKKNELQDPS